jgi:hypothetical protein
MESRPTIEQFINDCFRERLTALKMVLEIRRDYRRRHYNSECDWDSRQGVVELNEAEKIVSVFPSNIEIHVVTTGNHPNHRSRYHVKSSAERWLIHEVDTECGHCRLFGTSTECTECGGTGWMRLRDRAMCSRPIEKRAPQTTISLSEEESATALFHYSAIEQFMIHHFLERTAVLKKEMEIQAEYANRFYGAEYDWTRTVVSLTGSESERIVNVVAFDIGAQVTTRGFGFNGHMLRYDLRPSGQSWLIWDVVTECLLCMMQGRKGDCFWCGGAGWDDAQAKRWRSRGRPPGEVPPTERPQ